MIQLPPSIGIVEGVNHSGDFIPELEKRFRCAVEVRDSSWFQDLAYSFFADNNMCMVWNQLAGIQTDSIVSLEKTNLHDKGVTDLNNNTMVM